MQDPPSAASPQLLAYVGLILVASLIAWWGVLRKLHAGESLIPFTARRETSWGLGDAGLILGGWFFFMALFATWFRSFGGSAAADSLEASSPTPLQIRNLLLAILVANLVTMSLAALWLRARGATKEIGFPGKHLAGDILLGARVFAVAAAPVYGLQMILTQFFPSKHPAIELLVRQANPATVALVVISAAIVAPLVEEFLFRLVLQGALEGAEQRMLAARTRTIEKPAAFAPSSEDAAEPLAETTNPFTPYAAPQAIEESEGTSPQQSVGLLTELPPGSVGGLSAGIWPIIASSSFFALLHIEHGPDPIPLAIFAAILGYVYRQTHRLTPSIVTHLLLNSCSLVIFWLQPV